ncbi:hypothetical protein T8K17_22630 [Thalassobaculum sp. OXR-137]|uniref:hypothetical protein n=1 Tax=Thalassobaculum sp. OXR-137 TaxID=3100173 RepID=UPI002AC8A2A3|nr:hypothetical protein [Thalassobaculum sp. OXR-137]WPZ34023.1 hypothetical protein T8K17_22630 [Thalassobaculum sp. OXR-137]
MVLRPDLNGMLLQLPDDMVVYQVVNGKRHPLPKTSAINMLFIPGARVISQGSPDEPSTAIRWSLSTD